MQIAWDEEEDEFLTRYYGEYTAPEIAKMLGRSVASIKNRVNKLNIKLSPELREQRMKQGQFKKGFVPSNKGKKLEDFMSPETIERLLDKDDSIEVEKAKAIVKVSDAIVNTAKLQLQYVKTVDGITGTPNPINLLDAKKEGGK